jgi:uncharacterized protein YndB with AHSA1/START domain
MNRFALVTHWQLDAPIEPVWKALYAVEDWPRWWKYVRAVEELRPGDASGVGAIRRCTWASRLPYQLTFQMRSTVVDRPHRLEGEAIGELTGTGRWTLSEVGPATHVRYDWHVAATRRWMNVLAPLLEPAFRWNHGQVMAEGGRGLAAHLGVRLLAG